jgi:GT2 family glycosyltransferase
MSTERPCTNGHLPLGPFRHLGPTAVRLVELDAALAAIAPAPAPASDAEAASDVLLLARLHDDPLALIHLRCPVGDLDGPGLRRALWPRLAPAIARHTELHRCITAPAGSAALGPGLGSGPAGCPCERPPDPCLSVAVVIPTADRPAELERCLDSLATLGRPKLEVIVVDNRPSEPGAAIVVAQAAKRLPGLRYLPEPRVGISVARNRGVAQTTAEIVAFTDDDAVVDRRWLDWLLAPFVDEHVEATTGMVLPLALATPAQKRFEQFAGFSKGLVGRSYDLSTAHARDRFLYPYWGGIFGSGNSMAFRRDPLVRAGGFDPALGAGSLARGGEDIDALSAVILRGRRIVYVPRSVCWHEHRRDDEALRRQLTGYGIGVTAVLAKALLHDRCFPAAAARSVPVAVRARHARASLGAAERDAGRLPPELASLVRWGLLRGPVDYLRSARWARSHQLDAAIRGR